MKEINATLARPLSRPSPSVLLVDDDEFANDIMTEMLWQMGIEQVHAARGGKAALTMLGTMPTPPDFLILDLYMPDMDGIELMEAIARRKYAGGIIMVSGGDVGLLSMSQQLGAANGLKVIASLMKPVLPEHLKAIFGT